MIDGQEEKLKAEAENIRNLELKPAEFAGANDLRSAEDRHTSVKVTELQIDCRAAPPCKCRTVQGDRFAGHVATAWAELTLGPHG
jgi:hypothetical protein